MRLEHSLSGTWQFQLDPTGALTVETLQPDREICVPLPWQAAFPELATYIGYAWYRTDFEMDETWLNGDVLIHFGAVDYWCEVFINGTRVIEHEGGYTPFTVPIRAFLQPGRNQLVVRVYDSTQTNITLPRWYDVTEYAPHHGPPFDAQDIPHGKQEWYINVSGIWQDVLLTSVPKTYIDQVHILPDVAHAQAQVRVRLGGREVGEQNKPMQIVLGGSTTRIRLQQGQREYTETISIPNPHLWNLADPFLYTVTVRLETESGTDEVQAKFGMREITTRSGQLLLNGEPLFLLAALDQDIYADTIYTVPSDEYLRSEFTKAQELGLNCLRCHIKPPDPRYLDLADEMGLLVWQEIPSWRTFFTKSTVLPDQLLLGDDIKARVARTLRAMIDRDMNHPSLIIWTVVNEDWGTSLPLSQPDRVWVAEMYDFAKALDPTRLVVDNSACVHAWGPNIHVKSDLDDFHIYANIPDQAKSFEQTMQEFDLHPLWTWSSLGDSQRRGDEPLILSEFGNWGLPSLDKLRAHYGGDPAWFNLGPWWSGWEGEPGWASGVQDRFRALGLDTLWKSYEEFAIATQWHEYEALKFQIETLRRQPALAGYVITELADIYWESNGLLDFLRNPKVFCEVFRSINAPDVLVPEPEHFASWDDDWIGVRVHGSHYSERDWTGARLKWTIQDTNLRGEREITPLERGTVAQIDEHLWRLPRIESTRLLQLELALEDANQQPLANNTLGLLVIPAHLRRAQYTRPLAVIGRKAFSHLTLGLPSPLTPEHADLTQTTPDRSPLPAAAPAIDETRFDLATSLRQIGYQTTNVLNEDIEVAVTNLPDAELLRWVRDGGKLLFLSSGASPFFWTQSRSGAYSGNWITSYTWLRTEIHKRLKVTNPIGLAFRYLMPLRTIVGLPVLDPAVQNDFLAGMVSGWVRHPAVHTVQFRYGKGRVIMTTFDFQESLPYRPAAVAMIHDLVEHLASDACDPTLKANY